MSDTNYKPPVTREVARSDFRDAAALLVALKTFKRLVPFRDVEVVLDVGDKIFTLADHIAILNQTTAGDGSVSYCVVLR